MFWFFVFLVVGLPIIGVVGWGIYVSILKKKNIQSAVKQGFNVTKTIGDLKIDEPNKKWMISSNTKIHNFSDIADVEIIQNGEKFKSNGGVFRSVVGGVTFGLVGAIIGASTTKKIQTINNLSIIIYLSDLNCPMETIRLISSEMKTDGAIFNLCYQNAQQIASALQAMQHLQLAVE